MGEAALERRSLLALPLKVHPGRGQRQGHLAMQAAAVRQLRDHRLQGFPLAVGGERVGCGVSGSQSGKISSRMVRLLIACLVECLASNQHFAGGLVGFISLRFWLGFFFGGGDMFLLHNMECVCMRVVYVCICIWGFSSLNYMIISDFMTFSNNYTKPYSNDKSTT